MTQGLIEITGTIELNESLCVVLCRPMSAEVPGRPQTSGLSKKIFLKLFFGVERLKAIRRLWTSVLSKVKNRHRPVRSTFSR